MWSHVQGIFLLIKHRGIVTVQTFKNQSDLNIKFI